MAVDGAGNVHVAWEDYTNYGGSGTLRDIFYKRWNATSSTWTTTEVISTESTGTSMGTSMAVDGAGNVHVAWYDYRDIFYKRWNATSSTWTTTEVVSTESTGPSTGPSMAVDGARNVHVAWMDNTNYGGSGTDPDIFYKKLVFAPNAPVLDVIVPNPDYDGIIDLNWNEVSGATEYYVYRNRSTIISVIGLTPIATISVSDYQDAIINSDIYYYVIVAGNATGNSSISNCESVVVDMVDSTPPAAITDLSIINSTKTSITLSWMAPGDNGNIGTSTGYIIKYSTIGPINESNWEEITSNIWTKSNAVVAGNTEICKVLLLNSYTNYWFAIKAYDEVFNYGNISNSPRGSTVPWWRQDIQIGDILLHRSSNPLGWVLNWTHAGIYVGNYFVVEAEKDKDGGIRSYNISDWDFPNDTYVSLLRVVSASVEQREGAAQWALDQTKRAHKPKYRLDFTGKSYDLSTESWYCSELVWAAYINQPTNNYVWWGINIDMGDEGDVPITWEPVSPDDIYNDNDTRVINGHYEHYPEVKPFLIIKTNCPVDLLIIDPDNLQRGKGIFEIPDAYYLEYDFNHDGSPDDFILIPDLKIGNYSITVIPESGVSPTDTYSLIVLYGNITITLAQNLSINDIPNEPYVIRSTSEGIYYEPPQKYDGSTELLWINPIILTVIITATASISVIITVIIIRKKKRKDLEKK
jgi:uncharacterized protein YycO